MGEVGAGTLGKCLSSESGPLPCRGSKEAPLCFKVFPHLDVAFSQPADDATLGRGYC